VTVVQRSCLFSDNANQLFIRRTRRQARRNPPRLKAEPGFERRFSRRGSEASLVAFDPTGAALCAASP